MLQFTVNVMHYIKSRVCLLHVSSDKSTTVKHLFKDIKAFLRNAATVSQHCALVRVEEVKRWKGDEGEYL